jgi:hypothetical protein
MFCPNRDTTHDRRDTTVTKILLAILTLAAGWSLPREALAQPLRTVAFIDAVKFPAKATQAHGRLRATLEETISPKSWFLVETPRPIADCGATPDCMAKVARDVNTQYVLRIAGQKSQEYAYEISLGLYSAALGGVRESLATCDICDPGRMAEVASKAAVDLLVSVQKEEASLRERAKQEAPVPSIASQPPSAPPAALVTPPPVPSVEPATRSWIPWTLIGVGAVATVYGVWATHENGQSTGSCSDSPTRTSCDHYSSQAQGIVGIVGGGALMLTGAVWLFTASTHATTVAVSPNHVALNVRF